MSKPYVKKTNNPNMGRPKKELDKELFQNLCSVWCTEEEIAHIMDCSVDTIKRWCLDTYGVTFAECYKKFSDHGKSCLRRYQLNLAKTNASMAIFLGKVVLGQRENAEIDTSEPIDEITLRIVDGSKDNEQNP